MKPFLSEDFLLETETAKELFYEKAKSLPVIDFHNHLNPKEIYEDRRYDNLTQAWLGGDHYKWRAMRAWGVSEEQITGGAKDYDKFVAWADTVANAIGNPLYHWTHLELLRYFGIRKPLTAQSAGEIWQEANETLHSPGYSARGLLRMQNVKVLCTTDDPADSLEYHRKLRQEGFEIAVLPTFRPEVALGIEKEGFLAYMEKLGGAVGRELLTAADLLDALEKRLDYFVEAGCVASDHSLEGSIFRPSDEEEVTAILRKRRDGKRLTKDECDVYHGFLLSELGKKYAKRGLVMQLHIGAMRNNATRMFRRLGPDAGVDGMGDFPFASQLAALLDDMDRTGELPKTVLYYLNPKDAEMLSVLAGCFQDGGQGIRGKLQLGSAWWFCDHKTGMERQLTTLASTGMLPAFIGMLTDSRSFLSFPRHEYFRRILCNVFGGWVERGEYPADLDALKRMVEQICCGNARRYFGGCIAESYA